MGLRILVFAGIAAAMVGCSSTWQVRNVTDVGGVISLDISSCNAAYEVGVEETTDLVRVTVTQTDAGDVHADCADEVRVDLERSLGDRAVVVNGEEREVRHP